MAPFAEPTNDAVFVSLAEAETALLSSCCLLEASIVATSRLGPLGQAELEYLLDAFFVEVASFTPDQAVLAVDAWQRFGKARYPGGLSIIDCCSHALAAHAGRPLLAVDDDFGCTDVELLDLTALMG